MKRLLSILLCAVMGIGTCIGLAACGGTGSTETSEVTTNLQTIDNSKWQYNSDDDVYYQIGISYCEDPADESYETLAVFVPGAYMDATDNGDGTYTCELNTTAEVNGYTAETAPIVMPINTPGYSAQDALTDYTSVSEYTNAGLVYVHAGCRGRDEGAPAGVTDLKAAIRYLRYSDEGVAGSTDSIFVFGMSGGGAQSAIVGATGDSELYDAYLEEIGAVQGVSDAVAGSMDWCPITNLDTADEAYEWMMGVTRSGLSDDEQAISDALAEAYATYVNEAGIKDEDGNVLTLEDSEGGIYQAGSYYEYMKSVIENSLNNFLSDTEFPYDASSSSSGGGMPGGGAPSGDFGGGMPGGGAPTGEMPGGEAPSGDFGGEMPSGEAPSGEMPDGEAPSGEMSGNSAGNGDESSSSDMSNAEANDDITRTDSSDSGITLDGTYETAQDYIDALNADGEWVTYDADSGKVTITSIEDFVKAFKGASKNLGAFDQLDAGQGENTLFGYGDGEGAHFDSTLASILKELGNDYASDYESDLAKKDSCGNTADTRLNMYTPLYYLLESQKGFGTSTVAKYWRIRTGIEQGDCALSTEMNLALALENYEDVESVDFETVWGQGHTQAERTGSATDNFITWVEECTK